MLTCLRVGLMLHPASRPAHHLPWLPSMAFINSNRGNLLSRHYHWNRDRCWSGSNLPVAFINSNWGKPPLTLPPLESRSSYPRRLPSTCPRSTIGRKRMLQWWRRLGRSHDIRIVTRILESMMTWCLDKWWRGSWNWWCFDVRIKFVGHVLGLCEWSHIEVMWLVGLVTMTLQLPSLLDASSVKRGSRLLMGENSMKNLPTLWRRLKRKIGENENILAP